MIIDRRCIRANADSGGVVRCAWRRAGFTLMESLVLIGILIILLSIFIPYLTSLRETSRRISCAKNLGQIRVALQSYAHDNFGDYPRVVYDSAHRPDGYVVFTGADDSNPFAANSTVQPGDVTASLWLLVREKYVTDTRIFICPSTEDSRDLMTDDFGQLVTPLQRGNFRRKINLSYSYANPFSSAPGYRLNDTKPADFVLMADKNPGAAAATVDADAPAEELAKANSLNHGGVGQMVLFAYGNVDFRKTPYCGIGNDNIYTARAVSVHAATQPTTVPNIAHGVVGSMYSAVQLDDTYLVPTADDVRPSLAIVKVEAPATAPATNPSTAATLPASPPPASEPATSAPASTTSASSAPSNQ